MKSMLHRTKPCVPVIVSGLFIVMLSSSPALADCSPEPTADGDIVVCTGLDTDGLSSTFENLDVTVEAGAEVRASDTGSGTAILVNNGATVTNHGLITLAGDGFVGDREGIAVVDSSVIVNNGQIVGLAQSGTAILRGIQTVGTNNLVTNNGIIDLESFDGIVVGISNTLEYDNFVINNGEILVRGMGPSAAAVGINGPNIENHGLIDVWAMDDAMGAALFPDVIVIMVNNSPNSVHDFDFLNQGVIRVHSESGTADGVTVFQRGPDSSMVNDGTIDVTSGGLAFGVTIYGGTTIEGLNSVFINNGIISVTGFDSDLAARPDLGDFDDSSGVQVVLESAAILGLPTNVVSPENQLIWAAQQSVINNGSITGLIDLRHDIDSLTNSGSIWGDIDFGSGNDILVLLDGSFIEGHINGEEDFDAMSSSGDTEVTGEITDFEELIVENGSLQLNGGTSSIDQITVESGGIFSLGSHLIGALDITSGGRLQGNGTVEGPVANAGVLAPGNSIGTFNIAGDYVQTSQGTLEIEFSSSAADQLDITGTADLDGTLEILLQADSVGGIEGKTFTILLSDGGVVGQFDKDGIVEEGFWTVDISTLGNQVDATFLDVNVPLGISSSASGVFQSSLARAVQNAGGS